MSQQQASFQGALGGMPVLSVAAGQPCPLLTWRTTLRGSYFEGTEVLLVGRLARLRDGWQAEGSCNSLYLLR